MLLTELHKRIADQLSLDGLEQKDLSKMLTDPYAGCGDDICDTFERGRAGNAEEIDKLVHTYLVENDRIPDGLLEGE